MKIFVFSFLRWLKPSSLITLLALFQPTVPVHAAPQASLVVSCAAGSLCNSTQTDWTLEKTAQFANGSVSWTIDAVKGAESHAFLTFTGSLSVTNTGAADATIGNILVNLQKKLRQSGPPQFATISTNIADVTSGDSATMAQICSQASSERFSSFSEGGGSGTLGFADASNNTIFSLAPQQKILAGQTVLLRYTASFDATALQVIPGDSVRLEAIVSFGNAGGRGDGGASCSNIDVNGNGLIDADESSVRSVPCRSTWLVPALERSNSSVILEETASSVSTTGTASVGNFFTTVGAGSGFELLSASATRLASVSVNGGSLGGTVTDCAEIRSYPVPACREPVFLRACSTVDLDGEGFREGDFCTYSQGGWGATPTGGNAGVILASNFTTVFPAGVEVGVLGAAGYSMQFSTAGSVASYLPATGIPGVLTADLVDPTSSSSGVFGGQVLALAINLAMNEAGVIDGTQGSIAGLKLQGTGGSLDGRTVSEILAAAELALGGGGLPAGYTFATLNQLVANLDLAFDNCSPSEWAQEHLQ